MVDKLSSQWGKLNKHLLAAFFEVKRDGKVWVQKPDSPVVYAPLSEGSIESTMGWQSQFEHSYTDSKAPTIAAMMQSGALDDAVGSVVDSVKTAGGRLGSLGQELARRENTENTFLTQFEGRSGMTKLNSMQVFTGMAPMKIPVTAVFRAWSDPVKEVEAPFNQLMAWFLPEKLSDDGTLAIRGLDWVTGGQNYVEAMMPSLSPVKIGMRYKGRTYLPLVIESLNQPINSPIDRDGHYVEFTVQMSLGTLAAVDRDDWKGMLR